MAIIEVRELTRTFQRRKPGWRAGHTEITAVRDLSFNVEAGTSVGYIGANGAGKSTTIKMLTGVLAPTSGTARVCGLDPVPQRRRLASHIGVLFGQRSLLWWDLPLRESYPILGAMHRRPDKVWRARLDVLTDELELSSFLDTPVRSLSLGQRMRGEMAAALLHEPELVVLDEPTIGLDMLSKDRLRHFLDHERRERGTTILLTTHDMGDVQRLCERLIVINDGQQVFDGSQQQLTAEIGAHRVLIVDVAEDATGAALDLPPGAQVESVEGVRLRIAFDRAVLTSAEVLDRVQTQLEVVDISLAEPDIEDLVRSLYLRERR